MALAIAIVFVAIGWGAAAFLIGFTYGFGMKSEALRLSGRADLVVADAEAQQKRNLKALPGGRTNG